MRYITVVIYITAIFWACTAQNSIDVEASITTNASTGDFAPYFIGSLNHGKLTQKNNALVDFALFKELEYDGDFEFGFGVEGISGYGSRNDYARWNVEEQQWTENSQGPSAIWLQQLYMELRFKSIMMSAGLKEHTPALLNPELSSGDFIESGNARPIPELRGGFTDFVDIPLTQGWIQMHAQLAYGKMVDDRFVENHFNYYTGHIASGSFYTYKFCYFRSNPDQPFMVTAGMQAASIFGGKAEYYNKGQLTKVNEYDSSFKSFFKMLIPVLAQGEDFVQGSSLGSWDFYSQYMFDNGDEISAYFQWPFEDGSGIARRNQADGIWGLEYRSGYESPVAGIVLEYIDFRDQSGPILFAPSDYNSPTISQDVSGRDNYYNNGYYNAYANYGMSIGTPFLKSPIYNLDGNVEFASTRASGFHFGMNGYLRSDLEYRLLLQYQRGLGTYLHPFNKPKTNTSVMGEFKYQISDNFGLKVQVAYDNGELRGNNFGALLSLTYRN